MKKKIISENKIKKVADLSFSGEAEKANEEFSDIVKRLFKKPLEELVRISLKVGYLVKEKELKEKKTNGISNKS